MQAANFAQTVTRLSALVFALPMVANRGIHHLGTLKLRNRQAFATSVTPVVMIAQAPLQRTAPNVLEETSYSQAVSAAPFAQTASMQTAPEYAKIAVTSARCALGMMLAKRAI